MAVLQGAMVYRYAQRQQEFSTSIVLEGICLCGMLCVWLGMGVRSLWISPRDTALLLLIEEAIEGKQPNKSPQHNAGIGPAALDSASPLRPALSSEETARPHSPRR